MGIFSSGGDQQQVINSGASIKVQANNSAAFNFSLSGSEVEVT